MDIDTGTAVAGVAVAVIATALAVWQVRLARAQTTAGKDQVEVAKDQALAAAQEALLARRQMQAAALLDLSAEARTTQALLLNAYEVIAANGIVGGLLAGLTLRSPGQLEDTRERIAADLNAANVRLMSGVAKINTLFPEPDELIQQAVDNLVAALRDADDKLPVASMKGYRSKKQRRADGFQEAAERIVACAYELEQIAATVTADVA
ncbi:MAG: hypothetical protein HOU81_00125 [Hamadaea sp.]|uniref:hypothetical protein n=1 Tax=Hamadaea sp. TaxID=2024425 RepID=UPI001853ABE8|nr:hypothetical protein [Hamadaea sp.]NUR69223.1 hypothetical protein [Hamadaea sp.]NUT22301.1 hypothetical protein [Hamadaea sp.]